MYSNICLPDHSLRDYQQEAKVKIFAHWDEVDNVMYQMPTGTGKTRLFTSIIRDINLNSLRSHRREGLLIIAHRTELIEQLSESLDRSNATCTGSICANDNSSNQPTTCREI